MKRIVFYTAVISAVTLAGFYFHREGSVRVTSTESSPAGQFPLAKASAAAPAKNHSIPTPQSAVPAPGPSKTVPTAFAEFSHWTEQFTNASTSLMDGERLAWQRREAMLDLIQTDPAKAIELSVPFAWRQSLPPQVTRFFEEQVDGRGDFMVAVGTDFSSGRTTTFRGVQLGGRSFQAFVYGRRQAQISRTGIPLHGIALDGKMAVSSQPLRALTVAEAVALDKNAVKPDAICSVSGKAADGQGQQVFAEGGGGVLHFCGTDHFNLVNQQWALAESGGTSAGSNPVFPTAADDAWTHGPKSLLYMRVNFPDDLTEPISEAAAYAAMNGVNNYYTENSYDLTSLTATVTPLVTLPQIKAWYASEAAGPGQLLADARAAAKAAGFDTTKYERDIVAHTSVPGFNWGGLGSVGGKGVWLQSMGVGVTAHELGHNYGLWHANFWNTLTNFSMIGAGTNLEYGNIYDTMGQASAGNNLFNAVHKNILDWLKADAVQSITSNGVYRIYPFDVSADRRVADRFYAAAVKRDSQRDYWLEFRQKFTGNPWLQNGLLLNWTPWNESNGGAQLIDTTPGSPDAGDFASRSDAPVVIGRTFNDNAAGVHITPVQRGATGTEPWIEYQVNLGAFPTNRPPVLAVEVDQTNAAPGTLVHFHATATDPDGEALAYAWTFDDLTFSTNNQPWISKKFSTSGDHVIRCVVSDMKGGEASANTVVSTGISTGYRLSGRVTNPDGIPLEGVLVGNGQIHAGNFIGGYTDSDGRYVLVNVAAELTLQAFQSGYTFTNLTWSNPVQPTNEMVHLDFIALPLPAVSISADTNAVTENDGTEHQFTITRTGSVSNDLSVNLDLSDTATPGSDYTLDPGLASTNVITIPAGTNRVTYIFHALNDSLVEGPETVTLTALDDDLNMDHPNYALAPLAEATITILDEDAPIKPTVTIAITTPVIAEDGIDSGQLVFKRNGSTTGDLFVNYSIGGTAAAGVDYTALPGVVLIPTGQSSTTVPLTVIDDKNLEPDETVIATITANAAYNIGVLSSATVTILDDDFMTVTVSPTSDTAAEPGTAGRFTVKRDGDLTGALVVNYNVGGTASNGVDYAALGGTLTIPAGSASADIAVTPIDDALLEGNESVVIALTNDFNYDVGAPGSATLWIRDNEKPTVTIQTTADGVSEQGSTPGQFAVSRTGSSGDLTVYFAVSGTALSGIDYVPLDNPVVIPDGSSSVTMDVIPFQDLSLEPIEDVVLTLQTNANYNVGSPVVARVTILDDGTSTIPAAGFCFATSAIPEGRSPGIAVALSTNSSMPAMVSYRVIGGTAPASRYVLPDGTLTIASTTSNLVAFIPLQIVNDTNAQPSQTIRVAVFNPINATLDGIKIHTYTILDDDTASVSVTAVPASAAETGVVAGNFRITRAGPTNASQLVNFQLTGTASAPTDYAPIGNPATIPAGAAFVDLPVTPMDDRTMEFSQTVVMTLISAAGGNIISPNVATVTIADNDTNTQPVVSITTTNHPYAVEGGGNGEFLFTRTGATTNALTVLFTAGGTANNGADYTTITNGATIPIGQSSAIVPVAAVDDALIEGDETVTVSLTGGGNYRVAYPAAAVVTIQDNDQRVWIDADDFTAAEPGVDTGEFTFSRFGTTNTPATIFFAISGTASNGVDYVRITNQIVIPAGSLAVKLPMVPIDDVLVEGPETVTLTLQSNSAYTLGTPASGTVTIHDDEPMLSITTIVTNVLEGSGSNGVFRITRSGNPNYDFTAHLAIGGAATFGVDYPPFATNIYFSCGILSIDLFLTPTNEVVTEGDEPVTATILPDPAYSIIWPSNAVLTIADAGNNQTPQVIITSPRSGFAFLNGTNAGLVLNATVIDDSPTNTLTWMNVSGPNSLVFGDPTTNNTTVLFTNSGIYHLRLTADDGQLQGRADLLVFVSADVLTATNILHWTLDEGGGTNVADTSGSGRDGTFSGQPSWMTNGVLAGAVKFSGTNDCVRQSGGSNTLNGLNAFTVALWIKPASVISDRGFLTAEDAGMNPTFGLSTRAIASCGNFTNVIEAVLPTSGGVVKRTSASSALQPGQWQHVALTWTNGGAPKLYVNGRLDQPLAGLVAASGVLTNCPQFIVGKGAFGSPASWNGSADDVRVFDVALSAEEILALATGPVTNHAPVVDAGPDVAVQLEIPITLTGLVTDDGLPNPPANVTNGWSYLGTNNVTIPNAASLTNTFVFSVPGDYIFRLTSFDGEFTSFDDATITVLEPILVSVYSSDGDANELGPDRGEFTVTRTSETNQLTVYLAVSGTASNGVDFVVLTNVVFFAVGSNNITLPVLPILDDRIEGDENVTLTVLSNAAYFVSGGPAMVTIHDSPYGLWSIQQFTLEQLTFPNISGAAADFEQDGLVNFVEYAFNLDPKTTDVNPAFQYGFEVSTNDNKNHFTLTYTRRLPPTDVAYNVYVSTNLLSWNTGTNFIEEFSRSNNANGITETVKARAVKPFPATTNLFMKINVQVQQVPAP